MNSCNQDFIQINDNSTLKLIYIAAIAAFSAFLSWDDYQVATELRVLGEKDH